MNENIKKIEELLEKGQYAEVLIAIDKSFDKPLPTHIARFIEQFKQELWHSKPDMQYHGRLLLAVHELSASPTPLQDQIRELQANIKLLQKQYDTLLMEHKALQNEENTTLNELTEAKSNLITQKRQFERLLASQKAELQAKETEVKELQNAFASQKKDTVQIDALKKSVREGELAYQKIQGMYEGLLEKYNAQQTQQQTLLADYQRLKRKEDEELAEKARQAEMLARNLVWIEGGTFLMGSPENEPDRRDNEKQHSVTLSGFYICKYTVTVGEFAQFVQATKYQTDAEKEGDASNWRHDTKGNARPKNEYTHPVVYVSWHDAKAYCAWLTRTTGKTYSLPTEAQWEYACRAGKATPFSTGNNLTTDQANYDGNYPYNGNAKGVYRQTTLPVGSLVANNWGLYDMHGNVWEWCEDWYDDSYYSSAEATKPNPVNTKEATYRVLRGGSWGYDAQNCRSANRNYYTPTYRSANVGFRVVSF